MKRRLIYGIIFVSLILMLAGCSALPGLYVDIYRAAGEHMSVLKSEVTKYLSEGWYETPVTTVYSLDGRSEVVSQADVTEKLKNGWYSEPVTLVYATDGSSEVIPSSELEEKLQNGWFREPVALMVTGAEEKYVLFSDMEQYRKDGWLLREACFGLAELNTRIQQFIGQQTGEHGVYIKNLDTGDYLVLNDAAYRSASIIKLFQLAGAYQEFEAGNLKKDREMQDCLHAMITYSDNWSSNHLVKRIGHGDYYKGFQTENQYIKSFGCLNTQHMSLFIGHEDYVAYGSNRASPYDCGLLLEKLYNRTLVSPEASDEMLALLKQQTRNSKIPYALPEGTACAHKTGETSEIESDVGIVYSPGCDYIICVLTNQAPSGVFDIREISRMTYEYFN